MIKKIIVLMIAMFMFVSIGYAETIVLPDKRELNIDNLTTAEVMDAIKTASKSLKATEKEGSVLNIVKGVDVNDLQEWAKVITGTIKTVCQDLSITVNEFVKTPVGIGIAAMIAYKVMGKDLLANALDIVIMIPLWFMATSIISFIAWYFFSCKTVYQSISYDENGKKVKKGGHRVSRYPWEPKVNQGDMPNQGIVAIFLAIAEVAGTIITIIIVLG